MSLTLPQHDPEAAAQGRRFLSVRSITIGCAMAVVIGLAEPYLTVYLASSYLFTDYHGGGASFLIFMLFLLFNVLLKSVDRRMALTTDELLFVAAMMFASGSIVTSGGVVHMIPLLSSAYYYGNAANRWSELILPHLKGWMSPLDPGGGTEAIRKFWEGIPSNEPIPWGPWVEPLVLWGIYLMAAFACMAAMMALMRKHWVEHEHLSFPIAQVPAELCAAAGDPGNPNSIFRSKAFWAGLGTLFLLHSLVGVRYYLTGQSGRLRIDELVTFSEAYKLRIWVEIVVVGLVFLIPNRIAFSVWSLALVSWLMRSTIKSYGIGMQENMPYGGPAETQHMVMGALIVFVFSSAWYARAHLARAVRCALGVGERDYDRNEPTSYRVALLTIPLCAAVMLVWLRYSGLGLIYGVLFLLAFLAIYYAMARIVAQVGLPSTSGPAYPATYLASTFGAATLGREQIAALAYQFWNADLRQCAAAGTSHGMRLARRRNGLFFAMLLALLITYVCASLCTVRAGYQHGGSSLAAWFIINSSRAPWWWTVGIVTRNHGLNWLGLSWAGSGALAMWGLTVAHRTFLWWPLHPVAFLISNTHMVINTWFSIFLAWSIKALVVYFGGHRAFRTARRLFIGMILGGFLAGGLWAIIDLITGAQGNRVFAI